MDRAIDIFGIPELHRIYKGDDGYIHIGGSVTNDELDNSPLINELLPALAYCARRCGGPAIQNRATVRGNLCTASGAGNLPVMLLTFDTPNFKAKKAKKLTSLFCYNLLYFCYNFFRGILL